MHVCVSCIWLWVNFFFFFFFLLNHLPSLDQGDSAIIVLKYNKYFFLFFFSHFFPPRGLLCMFLRHWVLKKSNKKTKTKNKQFKRSSVYLYTEAFYLHQGLSLILKCHSFYLQLFEKFILSGFSAKKILFVYFLPNILTFTQSQFLRPSFSPL